MRSVRRIARNGAAGVVAGVATSLLSPAFAQLGWYEDGADPYRMPPLTLPETLRGTIRSRALEPAPAAVRTIREIAAAIGACWALPTLPGLSRAETTIRFSLRRDGALFGEPQVSYAHAGPERRLREALIHSTVEAIRRCTPLRFGAGLGAAIAGRPIAIRFIYEGQA